MTSTLLGRAMFAEQAGDILMLARQREGERRPSIIGARLGVCATRQQELDRRQMTILGALVEGRESAVLARVDLGPRIEQERQHLDRSLPGGGGVERLVRQIVA